MKDKEKVLADAKKLGFKDGKAGNVALVLAVTDIRDAYNEGYEAGVRERQAGRSGAKVL